MEGTSSRRDLTWKTKRTLQLLIDAEDPQAEFYVWILKVHIYHALTSSWDLIQGAGRGGEKAKKYLKTIFDMLELDWPAQWCLVSLHASGLVGAGRSRRQRQPATGVHGRHWRAADGCESHKDFPKRL